MENITKVFFNPLLSSKDEIKALVKSLPVGSAHVFKGELLAHSNPGLVTSIDISMHNEEYFSNAVSMADLGEEVLARMKLFDAIQKFNDEYTIQQAPSSTFSVPLHLNEVHIFAVSERTPSYYDLCVGDAEQKTSCYGAVSRPLCLALL